MCRAGDRPPYFPPRGESSSHMMERKNPGGVANAQPKMVQQLRVGFFPELFPSSLPQRRGGALGGDDSETMWWVLSTVSFAGGSDGSRRYRICPRCRRHRFNPWVGKIPWRREWQPVPVFLPGKFHARRSLAGYSPWGRKKLDMTEPLTLCRAEVVSEPGGGPGRETGIYMYLQPAECA